MDINLIMGICFTVIVLSILIYTYTAAWREDKASDRLAREVIDEVRELGGGIKNIGDYKTKEAMELKTYKTKKEVVEYLDWLVDHGLLVNECGGVCMTDRDNVYCMPIDLSLALMPGKHYDGWVVQMRKIAANINDDREKKVYRSMVGVHSYLKSLVDEGILDRTLTISYYVNEYNNVSFGRLPIFRPAKYYRTMYSAMGLVVEVDWGRI